MHLVWFRSDLRIDDNPALYRACQKSEPVLAVFTATPKQWQSHDEGPTKIQFRFDLLLDLAQQLGKLGIPLHLITTDWFKQLPNQLAQFCAENKITDIWFNEEIPYNELQRDAAVTKKLKGKGINVHALQHDPIIPAEELVTQQGNYYRVFTPWFKNWVKKASNESQIKPLPTPNAIAKPIPKIQLLQSYDIKIGRQQITNSSKQPFYNKELWPATSEAAQQRLFLFAENHLHIYDQRRDIPSLPTGTSRLSPYLATGTLSPRGCLNSAIETCRIDGRDWRQDTWVRELAWREFYRYIMLVFPHVGRSQAFKAQRVDKLWELDQTAISAWQQGLTGFPIVDAAMRQLTTTGWMHNRLRMVTASFFCKLMRADWRLGESFFMHHLIDGDFPSNNGGWQWSSATGCDAAPWFRIFNPIRQSERFDPEGIFIKSMVPELADLDAKSIHNPNSMERAMAGYPEPILNYEQERKSSLALVN